MRYHWLSRHTKSQKDPVTAEDYKNAYTEWNDKIKETVPNEKLLVFNVSEGWAPLCKFLQVKVTSEPFSYLNNRKHFQEERM